MNLPPKKIKKLIMKVMFWGAAIFPNPLLCMDYSKFNTTGKGRELNLLSSPCNIHQCHFFGFHGDFVLKLATPKNAYILSF